MAPDVLEQTKNRLESTIKQAQQAIQTVNRINTELDENTDLERLISLCRDITYKLEKLALTVRKLPFEIALDYDAVDVPAAVGDAFEFKAGFTERKWFYMELPPLAKKKDEAKSVYMKYSVQMLLRRFFSELPPEQRPEYRKADLVYINVIDKNKDIRRIRDNDNLEYGGVTNAIAAYLLPDDGPFICNEHHFAVSGENDATQVLVIPHSDFALFLQMLDSGHFGVIPAKIKERF